MILELQGEGRKARLIINVAKSKILSKTPELCDINTEEHHLEIVNEIKYLGQIPSLENPTSLEVNNRIARG